MVTSIISVTLLLAHSACPSADNAGNITFLRQGFEAKPPSLRANICHVQFDALALAQNSSDRLPPALAKKGLAWSLATSKGVLASLIKYTTVY